MGKPFLTTILPLMDSSDNYCPMNETKTPSIHKLKRELRMQKSKKVSTESIMQQYNLKASIKGKTQVSFKFKIR
jgi:hypothetical protein